MPLNLWNRQISSAITPRFKTLDDWLNWLETAHGAKIDLGLTRIRCVAERMGLLTPLFPVITVAGTNGKGSSVAMLEEILSAAGHVVGAYTSPHIHRYNERVRISKKESTDQSLIDAFAAIDEARSEISLSYFEFGTLAALKLFHDAPVDIAILEIGLGGRLDASNIIDADIALITSIDLDHTDWLGNTREKIALEKAAIARSGKPVVCADVNPPVSLKAFFSKLGASDYQAGEDFTFRINHNQNNESWDWSGFGKNWHLLPPPGLAGEHQFENAAGVLAVCQLLPKAFQCDQGLVAKSLKSVRLPGRFERISGDFDIILDVAHNPAGIAKLVETLKRNPILGKTVTLFGVMADKENSQMLRMLNEVTNHWVLTAPDYERALPVDELTASLTDILPATGMTAFEHIPSAVEAARKLVGKGDRLLVTGSFYTVSEARELLLGLKSGVSHG